MRGLLFPFHGRGVRILRADQCCGDGVFIARSLPLRQASESFLETSWPPNPEGAQQGKWIGLFIRACIGSVFIGLQLHGSIIGLANGNPGYFLGRSLFFIPGVLGVLIAWPVWQAVRKSTSKGAESSTQEPK